MSHVYFPCINVNFEKTLKGEKSIWWFTVHFLSGWIIVKTHETKKKKKKILNHCFLCIVAINISDTETNAYVSVKCTEIICCYYSLMF